MGSAKTAWGDQRAKMVGEGLAPKRSMASRMSWVVSGVGLRAGWEENPGKVSVCGGRVGMGVVVVMVERWLREAAGRARQKCRCARDGAVDASAEGVVERRSAPV